jgi:nucleotide-binding universal stress UspA family protein
VHAGIKVECQLLEGDDTVGQLEEFTKARKIDLIALTNRKRNLIARLFNPGLTRKLIHQSSIPLLVFRA